ncbi:MAG: hypothetical protein JWR78_1647 [Mycobacterium sp.]|nr:hypothetical protein [Mycobacterium sp.]
MEDDLTITPRIGDQIGDVLEADIPGYYHLIYGKGVFEPFPTWRMVDGELVPVSQEEAMQAFRDRPLIDDDDDDDE